MMPRPRSTMAGSTAKVAATGAKKLTSKVWRKSSSAMSTRRTPGSCAALLISRSMGPVAAATSSSAAPQGVGVGDVAGDRRDAACSASSAAKASRRSVLRARPTTVAPARARSTAELGPQAGRGPGDDGHLAAVAPAEVGRAAGSTGGSALPVPRSRRSAGSSQVGESVQVGPSWVAAAPARPVRPRARPGRRAHGPGRRPARRPGRARPGPWPGRRRSRGRWSTSPACAPSGSSARVGPALGHREDACARPPRGAARSGTPVTTWATLKVPSAAASEPAPAAATASRQVERGQCGVERLHPFG